ncbi:MAG TPA: RNA-binding S4 domain-containing protein [Steroidobacteraceae bacterium]|nr:RNA-binding S4 domain-containing protein [Steroidobacteraceae bacterium]
MARHKRDSGPPHRDVHAGDDEDGQDARSSSGGVGLRVDKWLWCTRFFKTRSVAQTAVEGGHVHVNGDRVKASRQVKVGDRLLITRALERYEVDVLSIPERRGPAPEARRHYRETPESEAARAHVRELDRLSGPVSQGRPDKRGRRDLLRVFKGRGTVSDDGDAG